MLADLRQALRALRRSPSLTAVAMISLALSIGANVTVYSVVREMILNDVSAWRLDRLARIDAEIPYARYRDLRPVSGFQDLAFETGLHDAIWQNGSRGEMIWGMDTSPNFFEVLGIRPSVGRLYGQGDDGRPVAVITHGFWRKRLRSDPLAIGRTLSVNKRLYTVAGILPPDYRSIMGHGVSPEIYTPVGLESRFRCHPFGRLRDGATREQARQALAAAATSLGGRDFARQVATLRPLGGFAANAAGAGDERQVFVFFIMLFGVAAMMALIACSNVAGLLLARRISRRRELAIRQALGASRWHLARSLLAEALVLVAGGAAAGLALDQWLRGRLSDLRWPSAYNIPIEFHLQNDRGLFLYALLTACAALLVCSLGSMNDASLASALRANRRSLRSGFVALQVVLSMVLLTLGALFTRSFLHIVNAGPGFDADHVVIAAVHPVSRDDRERAFAWRQQVVERVRRIPGVISVTSTDQLPLMGEVPAAPLRRQGEAAAAARDVYAMGGGENYFATLGIPMLRGRDFEIADRERKPVPVIVNHTLARQFFGGADPIGARLVRGREDAEELEVVGVAVDSKMRTLGEAAAPAFYTPGFNGQLLLRVAGNPAEWQEPLRAALAGVDGIAALDIRPMGDAVAGALFPMRIAAAFVGSLGGLGLVLALVGLYGSVSYAVGRRTREMGIRAALGATRQRIIWTALRDTAGLVSGGAAIGLVLAVAAVHPLVGLLPDGLDPWDPRLFAAVLAMMGATGLAAAAIPARRAANVNPAIALRGGTDSGSATLD